MTVYFDTRQYFWAHGRQPRGRGSWAFQMGPEDKSEPYWVQGSMTYGEAKRVAAVEAKKRGVRNVEVCS